ncbi:caspase family protein [Dyadobacter sp. CY261]|uniref:caspase family protein n=1 Tax=Dyadobacter sp. CY261 TaxID=2907203 RepID=UPI001F2FD1CA|nr:caspase family protein [Dyadobacter sp. CY261]MCF0073492.1 caspase family protein [Dyadobacter sp. CY261]
MKNITNILIFVAVAAGVFFGYKWLKGAKFVGTQGHTYAVIVGISDYLNGSDPQSGIQAQLNDLRYCDDDARIFYDFLKSPAGGSVPAENIALLIDGQASKSQIISQMEVFFAKSGPDDRVIFYFAGHGANGFFATYDIDMRNMNTSLRHKDVKEVFKKCRAKTRLCFADACMSGSMKNRAREMEEAKPVPVSVRSFEDEESGLVVLMAARSYQYSSENDKIQHGYFTKYLVDGLQGEADKNKDELVTIKEAFDYLYLHLASLPKSGPEDKGQIPVIFGKYDPEMPVARLKGAA